MRSFLVLLLVALAAAGVEAGEKPNIVLILADDLGINDLGCYGRGDPPTPHIDRLAAAGLRFENAYCAQPICSPSRAALLTGKAPARLHLTTFLPGRPDATSQKLLQPVINQQLPEAVPTLPQLLRAQGYISTCIGKWHLGAAGPVAAGFDEAWAGRAATMPSASEGGKGEYELTRAALDFMEANRAQPFFLYLAHNTPHVPLGAKPDLVRKYRDTFNPTYSAMIETLDDTVGLVLAKLEALGLEEKTIVIFASDNGGLHVPEIRDDPPTHNSPFRAGKGFLYEGGLRVPLIVRWPGHTKHGAESTPVVLGDLMPTLLALADAPAPAGGDYVSLAGVWRGEPLPARPLFWHFPHYTNQGGRPAGAMRDGQWKLIEHYEDGHAELFDLASDPREMIDLSAKEAAHTAAMRGALAAWRVGVDAQENAANPDFDAALATPIYGDIDISKLLPGTTARETGALAKSWRTAMDAAVAPGRPAAPPGAGFIILPARDATIHGSVLRYEAQPQKNTLGFWRLAEDWASWDFALPAPGRYAVEALQGCGKGSGGATIQVAAGGETFTFTVRETGHFQNFVPVPVGSFQLPAGKNTIAVKPVSKPGAAVMDLRQITLTRIGD